ncbi:MAG: hypothetical protein ACI4AB_07430 [Acetatifactor sp.]
MEYKTTDELNHEIKAATDIDDYLTENRGNMLTSCLSEHLKLLSPKKYQQSRCCTRFTA